MAGLLKFIGAVLAGLLCLLLAGCQTAPRRVVSGTLHGELVWQGEVRVAGDVVLAEDVALTIMPGTRIRFLPADAGPNSLVEHPYFPGSELIVKGRLHAAGTPAAPIVFESAQPGAPPGSWGAINLEGSLEAVFAYCIFRDADSAVHSRDATVSIRQSLFENNLVGIRFHDTEMQVEHNLLRNNHTAIRFHFGAPVISGNQFSGNAVNLFITSHPRDYRIEGNFFGMAGEYQVVFGEEVPEDVFLPHNFWAVTEAAPLTEAFYDGSRSAYLGRVQVEPRRSVPLAGAGLSWSP